MQNLTVLPLHGGRAPRWLFSRMVRLSALISEAMIDEYGNAGFIERLSGPRWFQALACVIGYDWHSSGTTTVAVGALKEALNHKSDIFIAGGKGKQGTSTPEQITEGADHLSIPNMEAQFTEYSRLTAKIDSALVYDNLSIYHHAFIFSRQKDWAVIQQGMRAPSHNAIRFQIYGKDVDMQNITNETNTATASNLHMATIDLTYEKNEAIKQQSLNLVNDDIAKLSDMQKVKEVYALPARHRIEPVDISDRALSLLRLASELKLERYEQLLKIRGIGRKTLRSIAIIASLLYNDQIYKRDPIIYSYNVGGKDGIPYKINKIEYDKVISALSEIVKSVKIEPREKEHVLKTLSKRVSASYTA